jgi:hypothetical protein
MSIERLSKIRDEMLSLVYESEEILRKEFPSDYEIAYSFWIPQIVTAIKENHKWLSRGDYSIDKTIKNIKDRKDAESK